MSGKAHFSHDTSHNEHGNALVEGFLTSVSWMSIFPIRGATVIDRVTGARVMAALPVVGVIFGCLTAILLVLSSPARGLVQVDGLLLSVLIVAMWEGLNRLMHLDGLADVADALGSYAKAPRAQEILADPHTGLFGMVAAVLSLIAQISALAVLLDSSVWWFICFIPVIGRIAGQITAVRGQSSFSATGFGALVIGTVKPWWVVSWALSAILLAAVCGFQLSPEDPYLLLTFIFAVIMVAACVFSWAFSQHLTHRFDGLNGDCVGANIHLATTISAVAGALVFATIF